MSSKTNDSVAPREAGRGDWVEIVRKKVEEVRFGSVQIIVHEGRVTLIESVEKTRLPAKPGEGNPPS